MKKAAISRASCVALLAAAAAQAQTVAAGARAVVSSDTLSVYASMSESSDIKATLRRGDTVVIGLVLFGSDITWCAISKAGDTRRLGFASCEFLEPDRAPPAPAPPPPAPKPIPLTIRPTEPAPATPREMPSLLTPPNEGALPAPKPSATAPLATLVVREPAPPPPPEPRAAPTPVREPPAPAPDPPASNPADFVEALLEGAGLRSALANYTQTTHLPAFLDKSRLAEIDAVALDRAIAGHFTPGAFYSAIGAQAQKNYSLERMPAVTDWLRSAVTTRLAGLERRAFSPEARDELVTFAGGLSANPPTEPRLLLIHRLYDSLKTCDMQVEATIALVHTVAQAIGPALPKEKRYSAAELDRALGAVKSRYRAIMKNARIVHYLFAYQTASDEELEQYVNFLESDNGKWLVSIIDRGFFDATETISRALLADIPRKVKPKRRLPAENTANGLLP